MSYFYSVTDRGSGNELLKFDVSDGSVVDSYQPSGGSLGYDFYPNSDMSLAVCQLYDITENIGLVNLETMAEEWKVEQETGNNPQPYFEYNGDILLDIGKTNEVKRISSTDGSTITRYTHSTLPGVDFIAPYSGGGWFAVDSYQQLISKMDNSGSEIWQVSAPVDVTGLAATESGGAVYVGSGHLEHLDSDGNSQWTAGEQYTEYDIISINNSGQFYTAESFTDTAYRYSLSDGSKELTYTHPDGDTVSNIGPGRNGNIYVNSDPGLTKYDSSGSVIYQVLSSTSFIYTHTFRFPDYGLFPEGWTITVSGTAVQNGSGISGAEIFVIDDDTDTVLTTTTTDSNGDWSASISLSVSNIHVAAQYTDGNGDEYNAKSLPYISL